MAFFDFGAEKAAKKYTALAKKDLTQGYNEAMPRYEQAFDQFSPYAERGNEANAMYAALLRGDPEAVQQFQSNPILQGQIGQDSNAMIRYLNGRGGAAGGAGIEAGRRVAQNGALQFLDRFGQLGNQGFQAAGAQAGIRQAQGDAAYGFGASKAGLTSNLGTQVQAAKTQGLNNLLGVVGAGTKLAGAAMGMPPVGMR